LDLASLLAPCPGAQPCGRDLESGHELYALESAAKEPDEPGIKGVEAVDNRDWSAISKQALALLEQSKDLRVAVLLSRALLHTQGLPGLASGLALIRGITEQYWGEHYPALEDDGRDADMRLNTLRELWNPGVLARLRSTIALTSRELGPMTVNDVLLAHGASSARPSATAAAPQHVAHALANAAPGDLAALTKSVTSMVEHVRAVRVFIGEKLGSPTALHPAPLLSPSNERPSGLLDQLARILTDLAPAASESTESERDDTSESASESAPEESIVNRTASTSARVSGEAQTREDVIRLLDSVCKYYALHEPSSPVPLLIQRAKRLVTMSFVDVIRDLADKGMPQVEAWIGKANDG
jgi:type VI secretion system protein ImpA